MREFDTAIASARAFVPQRRSSLAVTVAFVCGLYVPAVRPPEASAQPAVVPLATPASVGRAATAGTQVVELTFAPTGAGGGADCREAGKRSTFSLRSRTSDEVSAGYVLTCTLDITLPHRSGGRWALTVHALSPTALLTVQVNGRSDAWLKDRLEVDLATDASAADVELLLPDRLSGQVEISRVDLGPEPLTLEASVRWVPADESPEGLHAFAGRGHALRVTLGAEHYRRLVQLARGLVTRTPVSGATRRDAHNVLDVITGRNGDQWRRSATRSEPMVVFVGLSGINKVALSDLIAWPMQADEIDGRRYAEPWQTTFERGSSFWAVYLEEETSPFFTSIDAQFGRHAVPTEHDDFDPQGTARLDLGSGGFEAPRVRVGFKRFRMPDNYNTVQVTFSRQSATYGLRQWGRTFTQYGRFPFRAAGGVFTAAPTVRRRDLVLAPNFGETALSPSSYAIAVARTTQPLFITAALRYPQLRDSADQARVGLGRVWRSAIPEPVVGLGIPTINRSSFGGQSLLVGLSWPLLGDRVYAVLGGMKIREPYLNDGYSIDQRLPAVVLPDDLRTLRSAWKLTLGLNLDLAHSW